MSRTTGGKPGAAAMVPEFALFGISEAVAVGACFT